MSGYPCFFAVENGLKFEKVGNLRMAYSFGACDSTLCISKNALFSGFGLTVSNV
jgi:hypothetical protein